MPSVFVRGVLLGLSLLLATTTVASAGNDSYYATPLPMRFEQEGPTCVVMAGVLAMMVQDRPENGGRWPSYDWQGAWNYLVRRGEAGAGGTSVDAFLRFVRDVGLKPIPQQRQRIFRAWRDGITPRGYVRTWTTLPSRPAAFGGERSRIAGYDVLYDTSDTEAVKAAIREHGPVILTAAIDINWGHTRLDAVLKEPVGQISGQHALVIYGWTYRDGELMWYVANSWGEMWGHKGLALWPDHLRLGYWSYIYAIHDIDQ